MTNNSRTEVVLEFFGVVIVSLKYSTDVEKRVSSEFHSFVVGTDFFTPGSSSSAAASTSVVDVCAAHELVAERSGTLSTVFSVLVGCPLQSRPRRVAHVRSVNDDVASDPDRQRHKAGSPVVVAARLREDCGIGGDGSAWRRARSTGAMSWSNVSVQSCAAAYGCAAVPRGSLGRQQLAGMTAWRLRDPSFSHNTQ